MGFYQEQLSIHTSLQSFWHSISIAYMCQPALHFPEVLVVKSENPSTGGLEADKEAVAHADNIQSKIGNP